MPEYSGLSIPYFDVAFAESGDLAPVPDASQPSGTVSYTTGYGISYSTAVASGGYNFPRAQHNQILNDITTLLQYQGQGNYPPFITTAMNGGSNPFTYGLGAVCSFTVSAVLGNYVSTASDNTTTPGAMGAYWAPIASASSPLFVGGTSTGSANTQAVTTNQGNFSNTAGNIVTWLAGYSVTGTSSLNPDSVGAVTVKVQTANGLRNTLTGDIVAGQEYVGISDGTVIQLTNPSSVIKKIVAQKFTSSDTYTPTAGMVYCIAEMVGGGGGGGTASGSGGSGSSGGGGGGAGGYIKAVLTAAQVGASQTVTIGAAGTAGSSGSGGNGGTTSLGSLLSCTGGTGGALASSYVAAGGAGGAPTVTTGTGIVTMTGQSGGSGSENQLVTGGGGGSTPLGFGGPTVATRAGTNLDGSTGIGYGAGGSAGANSVTGGAGTKGYICITEYCG